MKSFEISKTNKLCMYLFRALKALFGTLIYNTRKLVCFEVFKDFNKFHVLQIEYFYEKFDD